MGEAFEFERRSTPYGKGTIQQGLQRYDHLLPTEVLARLRCGQRGGRAAIDAVGDLLQPAMGNVLAPQRSGIALALQPAGVHRKPFGQVELHPV